MTYCLTKKKKHSLYGYSSSSMCDFTGRTLGVDGYSAVQLGFDDESRRTLVKR